MEQPRQELIDRAFGLTKSSRERYNAMIASCVTINGAHLQGDIVECGVFQGGNIILSRLLCPEKVCWLYDTYAGMTRPDPILDFKLSGYPEKAIDRYDAKTMNGHTWGAISLDAVRKNFADFDLLDESHLRFVKGPVEETLLKPENLPDKIALLRLDTDWYASTKIELQVLYPRLIRHGILIIDDYGHWAGCRKAVDDYFADKERSMIYQVDYTCIVMVKSAC